MGRPKYIYFEDDILEQLEKSKNMSKLINDLLREHYSKANPETMNAEEIRKLIKIKKAEEEFKLKMEKIKNGSL